MTTHLQQCRDCGSRDLQNILVSDGDVPGTVYVRCPRCVALVARYSLSGYYCRGEAIESYLRSVGAESGESARDYLAEFRQLEQEALAGFQGAQQDLEESADPEGE